MPLPTGIILIFVVTLFATLPLMKQHAHSSTAKKPIPPLRLGIYHFLLAYIVLPAVIIIGLAILAVIIVAVAFPNMVAQMNPVQSLNTLPPSITAAIYAASLLIAAASTYCSASWLKKHYAITDQQKTVLVATIAVAVSTLLGVLRDLPGTEQAGTGDAALVNFLISLVAQGATVLAFYFISLRMLR